MVSICSGSSTFSPVPFGIFFFFCTRLLNQILSVSSVIHKFLDISRNGVFQLSTENVGSERFVSQEIQVLRLRRNSGVC